MKNLKFYFIVFLSLFFILTVNLDNAVAKKNKKNKNNSKHSKQNNIVKNKNNFNHNIEKNKDNFNQNNVEKNKDRSEQKDNFSNEKSNNRNIDFKKRYSSYFKKNVLFYKEAVNFLFEMAFKEEIDECYYTSKKITKDIKDKINCEHIMPQSRLKKFNALEGKSDLHLLTLTDKKKNSERSSFKFGEFEKNNTIGILSQSTKRFDVPDKYKGNIARAMFYASIQYGIPIDRDEEEVLRNWHKEDKVDNYESKRNQLIEKKQGNKNIFIENPNLVDTVNDF